MEPAASQPDRTSSPGVQCEIPTVNKAIPLPLNWLPGDLPQVEWLDLTLQQATLGGSYQDTGGAPQPPTQTQALRDPSTTGEAKHPILRVVEI